MDSFWVAIAALFLATVVAGAAAADDAQLLEEFRAAVPNQAAFRGWSGGAGACRFPGAGCQSGRLTSLSLAGVPLNADFRTVAATLLQLSSVEVLSLRGANVSGALAATGRVVCGSKLQALDLSGNAALRGSVADVAALAGACGELKTLNLSGDAVGAAKVDGGGDLGFASLDSLDLSNNKITGDSDLRWMVGAGVGAVRWLDLSFNRISGAFPEFTNCSGLQYLDMSSNLIVDEVSGGVLSDCRGLKVLNLSFNHFAGEFPPDIAGLASLKALNISNNNFSGELPTDAFTGLQQLTALSLSFNHFNSSIPDSVASLPELEQLDLSSNTFSGSIPSSLCQDPNSKLHLLYLQNNYLSGGIPDAISNCTKLVSLDLSLNCINGSIPTSLGELRNLHDLILWQNELEGEIPSSLSSILELEHLILDYNGLTGSIPPELAKCTKLNWISLASNRLSGPIPPWLGKLSNLAILKLSNNSFSGPIPPELGDCQSLVWLDLNSNQLNGSIPKELANQSGKMTVGLIIGRPYVYLRNDELSSECRGKGSLLEFTSIRPDDLSRMPSKKLCNFTRMYVGSTEYTFNKNGSMIFLDLSFNQLDSLIPKELGSMYYLMIMNLGHNLLSGAIPPELAEAKKLAVLDLSHNQLEGPIPNSFSTLSLSEINLSNNLLNGTIPELGSLATFPKSQYENNSGLCGFPLPQCEHNTLKSSDDHQSHRRQASVAGSIAMALLFSLFCIFGLVIIAIESKKRKLKNEEASTSRDIYIDSRSHSGTMISNWRLSSTNALSINLAAFEKPLQNLTLADLVEATNGFHNDCQIGSGGFGDVYKAQLKDGKIVAIKKLIHVSGQGDREFTAEMETIGKIKHRNLVALLGYCKVGDERLLVYDYMKFGSLEDVLHDRKKIGIKLNWEARRKIAVGAARGLAFLHHNCIPHIIHRDMKSSNVLIDEHLEARVSDFGMARMMSVLDTHLSVSTLAGTPGYVPPEYYQTSGGSAELRFFFFDPHFVFWCRESLICSVVGFGSMGSVAAAAPEEAVFRSKLPDIEIPSHLTLQDYCFEKLAEVASRPCLIDGQSGAVYSYAEVEELSRRAAAGLRRLGVGKGDVVMNLLRNCPEFAFTFLGAARLGAATTTANPFYTPHEIHRQAAAAGAKLIVTEACAVEKVRGFAAERGIPVVAIDGDFDGCLGFREALLDSSVEPLAADEEVDPDDVVALPYSSGTTGMPKGVMLTHRSLVTSVAQQVDGENPNLFFSKEDVLLCVLPLFHIYSLNSVLLAGLRAGSAIVIMRKFDLGALVDLTRAHGVTIAPFVPPIVVEIAKSPRVTADDLASIRMVMSGAAPMGRDLQDTFMAKIPNAVLGQGYGMTEAGPVLAMCLAFAKEPFEVKSGSCGTVVRNAELKIVDPETGASLGRNQSGEICIRGEQIMKGYLNDQEATKNTIDKDGWLHTGDIGYVDDDDEIFIVDRLKEIIKYKGFQVPPAELEALLITHPEIKDAAVVPMKDELAGEVPVAFIVRIEGSVISENEIKQFVAKEVVFYKRLNKVFFADSIPKSPSGKILRKDLRAKLAAGIPGGDNNTQSKS